MISFIVNAFDRPDYLRCCLASLKIQKGDNQIIVLDNSVNFGFTNEHVDLASEFEVDYFKVNSPDCYYAIEKVMKTDIVTKPWVCFPSDDSYYVPVFAERMLAFAEKEKFDLVYCNMLYGRPDDKYSPFLSAPYPWSIDKTNFILKHEKFIPFPNKANGAACNADGYLILELTKQGISHGNLDDYLVVHN